MPSTADATWARPLLHTRTLGRSLIAAMTRQVWYGKQCAKNKMFSLTNKYQVKHALHTHTTANWLKGGEWAKQTTTNQTA